MGLEGLVVKELNASQELWAEVFGLVGIPELDRDQVLAIVDTLPRRQALAVRLRFGFRDRPLTLKEVGRRLPRVGGGTGVSREIVNRELGGALRRLRSPKLRPAWDEARRRDG